ncbi:MAG: primosomal protein N', partial [Muribaculaceae bacterium]|nr:primosomal protein N' [Muribaculaceae bacterium]
MPKYAEVIVPLPLGTTFTYIIPDHLVDKVNVWCRVIVPFGSRKLYTAIVVSITDNCQAGYELKEIMWVPESTPILRRPQLSLWEWIANYYMCPIGDVYKAAVPAGLKLESETIITANPDFYDEDRFPELSPEEAALWEFILKDGAVPIRRLDKNGKTGTLKTVYSLIEKGAVTVSEKLVEKFKPRRERFITLKIPRGDSEILRDIFKKLDKNQRRQKLFMQLLSRSGFMKPDVAPKELSFSELNDLEEWDSAFIRYFAKKGWIDVETREISRFKWDMTETAPLPELSDAQTSALRSIHTSFVDHQVTLLRGVTSSGK